MNRETHATTSEGDTVVKFGSKFWLALTGVAWGPAVACLLAFWNLSDRVLIVEKAGEARQAIIDRQQRTLDHLDSNREGIATLIQKAEDISKRLDQVEQAVRASK